MTEVLFTARLRLVPMTLAMVEAAFRGDRAEVEGLLDAQIPAAWPGRALVERAFCASLDDIRATPHTRLWGDRVMVFDNRFVVGSVVFHGLPSDGIAEVGYGVEERWQKHGFATEATRACIEWALDQPGIVAVTATTPPWHAGSIRVLERCGLARVGTEGHELLGEVLRFERRRES